MPPYRATGGAGLMLRKLLVPEDLPERDEAGEDGGIRAR